MTRKGGRKPRCGTCNHFISFSQPYSPSHGKERFCSSLCLDIRKHQYTGRIKHRCVSCPNIRYLDKASKEEPVCPECKMPMLKEVQ